MSFEFNENKSTANLQKHGIDFVEAQKLWDDINRLIIPAKTVDETRFIMIAQLEMSIWSVIFTYREKNIRIISVRKARDNEKEIYNSK